MAKVGIMAYGTELDREKLSVLATIMKQSSSQWIIERIRSEYASVFGDMTPNIGSFKRKE